MNNVYVRDKNSIKLISLTRLAFILPLIVYGFYKNGISLYNNHYIDIYHLFKPIVMILAGLCIGAFVNIFYEKIIHKSKDSIMNILFSSFHIFRAFSRPKEQGKFLADFTGFGQISLPHCSER